MRFATSLLLLAALTSTTLARHGHRAHHEGHVRRQAGSTTTITTTETLVICPCDSSTSTLTQPMASSSPSTSVEVTLTLIPATSTSTSTETSTESTTTTTQVPPTTSSTFTTLPSTSTSSTSTSTSTPADTDWTSTPPNGEYNTAGFGGVTNSTGSGVSYTGNVGNPYGSNIIEVAAHEASTYKYVVQFTGSNTDTWSVVIWNKIGPDGKMTGWYNNACHEFRLAAGEVKYYAFDDDSQGGWAAAAGESVPVDAYGGYAATWGEFDFGSSINGGWSGFDVSAIQAQNAGLRVQGMKICSVLEDRTCSAISPGAGLVRNAYTYLEAAVDGIGGNLPAGAVRLAVTLDYRG